jgi:hypothetical protein
LILLLGSARVINSQELNQFSSFGYNSPFNNNELFEIDFEAKLPMMPSMAPWSTGSDLDPFQFSLSDVGCVACEGLTDGFRLVLKNFIVHEFLVVAG